MDDPGQRRAGRADRGARRPDRRLAGRRRAHLLSGRRSGRTALGRRAARPARRGAARAAPGVRARASIRPTCRGPRRSRFPTSDGDVAHALYYPPTNRDASGPPDERPPLVVMNHGGPTSSSGAALDLWAGRSSPAAASPWSTSTTAAAAATAARTCASSTASGASIDVDDCIAAARYLAERGDVDPAAHGHPRRQRRRLHDALRADLPRRLRRRRVATSAWATWRRSRATRTSSSRATSTAWSAPYPAGVEIYRERSPIHFTERHQLSVDRAPGP